MFLGKQDDASHPTMQGWISRDPAKILDFFDDCFSASLSPEDTGVVRMRKGAFDRVLPRLQGAILAFFEHYPSVGLTRSAGSQSCTCTE